MSGLRSTVATITLCAAALAAPGSAIASTPGQDAYAARFLLVNERIVDLGERVGTTITTAERKTDRQLARRFSSFTRRLGRLTERLSQSIPPPEWTSHHDRLVTSLPPVESALRRIARAARNHNAAAARRATLALIRNSRELRAARGALYRTIEQALEAP